MKKITALLLALLLFTADSFLSIAPVISQNVPSVPVYPKGYFRNPLGIPIQLAANFGELRTNHFHMGFDIRTNQRENLPVYAAADGYVSRIKIERYGFGKAIYIDHPNGYTTLYAHLNEFYDTLSAYVKNKQYADQKWEQEITFEPGEFPVTKGQFIAYSGNTGGSQGPHLHFEIRDTKTGNNLNPWLFDFGLPDKTPPFIYRLYYYDRRYSTYQTNPFVIPLKGGNGRYSTISREVVLASPYVSFGISAEDKMSTSAFRFGIYEAAIYVDDSLRSSFRLNDISYDDTRYINGSIDYKTRLSGGSFIQHLSRLPGNHSTIFSDSGNGDILLTDTLVHNALVTVSDATGNTSVIEFKLRWDPSKTQDLMFTANSIPMIPNGENELKTDDVEAFFSDKAFYDTVPFVLRSEPAKDSRVVSAVQYLHNHKVPVHDSFTLRIKTTDVLTDSVKDKVVMQMVSNHKIEAVKGEWEDNWMEAKFRDLGVFKLLFDNIPARVRLAGWANGAMVRNRKAIAMEATDNAGEIRSFNAYLDGSWIMFSRKDDLFIHTFDERTTPGRHELQVVVEDMAGNVTEKSYFFTR